GTGTTTTDGKFSVVIPKQKVNEILTVTATDAAGNVSAEAKQTVVEAPPEVTNRIAGEDRYATAVSISQEGWNTAETVVLATGANFPDALAGGPLAYKEDAPILLTRPTRLVEVTELEIKRLNAKKVIILGSEGAVSLDVETKLKQMGLVVERIGGENRFETAALIAERLPSEQAIIAFGFNFPDVLSISPYAAKNGIPILLTRSDRVPAETLNAMVGKNNTILVGSTSVISESVMKQFPQPVRYGGATRFDTGKKIITQLPMGTGKAYVATGRNFPDALAGSVLAAKNNAPILLVNETTIPTPTKDLILNYDSFSIFGSRGAVGDEVQSELDLALEK
ncbi:cell wall-binding repeat-containing protein, partial [Paenisporosarcina sp. TG20]|uniref:cell wall-binding repeat-containing protein n=1 Tax=Paenisporosarcina sp. TG20 TaxID=1211706 RepID=UPI00037E73D9